MGYSFESIVRFIVALILTLMFICASAFDNTLPLWVDLLIRLGGALLMFILGIIFSSAEPKEDNDA